MKNMLMLAVANLKKNKGQSFSLLLFVLIAVMLMNIGLTVLFDMGSFFDERAENVNAAHFTAIYYEKTDSVGKGMQFIQNYSGVKEMETLSAVGGMGDYYVNDMKYNGFILFAPADVTQKMDAPSLVGESLPLTRNAIYIPYFIMLGGD